MSQKGSKLFLRTFDNGLKLFVRTGAESYRRIVVDPNYWSYDIGNRVEEESTRQMKSVEGRTGKKPDSVVIEDGWHDSPGDAVVHAGVVYEDSAGNHLSKKHIAEKAEEQAKSDKKN